MIVIVKEVIAAAALGGRGGVGVTVEEVMKAVAVVILRGKVGRCKRTKRRKRKMRVKERRRKKK